mgnify:CR=1 FL=1
MKPETMDKISELLKRVMEEAETDLMYAIQRDYKKRV